jgi:hypothetical protein
MKRLLIVLRVFVATADISLHFDARTKFFGQRDLIGRDLEEQSSITGDC